MNLTLDLPSDLPSDLTSDMISYIALDLLLDLPSNLPPDLPFCLLMHLSLNLLFYLTLDQSLEISTTKIEICNFFSSRSPLHPPQSPQLLLSVFYKYVSPHFFNLVTLPDLYLIIYLDSLRASSGPPYLHLSDPLAKVEILAESLYLSPLPLYLS